MFVQLILLVICHTILADTLPNPFYDVDNYEVVAHHFENFIKTYQKKYIHDEKFARFVIFIKNLKEINALNANHKATFDIGKYTDLTKLEQRSLFGFRDSGPQGQCNVLTDPKTKDAPVAWDWRDKKVVSPVKDQGLCGSCWAFGGTALVESRYLQKGKQVILSEQQMIDCDSSSAGCNGGYISYGLTEIIKQGGQESEADYPYEAKNDTCHFDNKKITGKVINCTNYLLSDEGALKELLFKEGPLAVAVYAYDWVSYRSGIFDNCQNEDLNHAVLLVGYGSEGGVDFWVIKNSWGTNWGENGYIRLKRGVKCCGIGKNEADCVLSATVV